LRKKKHYSYRKCIREFQNTNWNHYCHGLDHVIKTIDESDSIARNSGSNRPRIARHDDIIAVADLVQSQEDRL